MRILNIDLKNNFVEVVPENLDDLWHLEKIIEPGDVISGHSDRKIKGKEEGDESKKIRLFLKLQAESIEFDKFFGLRVNGIILEGSPPQFIELKAHHSMEISIGEKVRLEKIELKNYQIERLEKAKKASARNSILLLVMDDEIALFALLKDFGVEEKCAIQSKKSGKQFDGSDDFEKKYFSELLQKIIEINCEKAIIAGPGFSKNSFQKFLEQNKGKLKTQFFFEAINSVGVTGLHELLKSHAVEKITQELEILKETRLVEKVFELLGKNSKNIAYGFEEINKAIQFGAIETLIVTDAVLSEKRKEIESLMDLTEKKCRGKVEIINSENDCGKKIQGIGGMAAILRFAIT